VPCMWAVADAVVGLCDYAGVPTGTPLRKRSVRGERDWKARPQRVRDPYPQHQARSDIAREYGGARGRPSEAGETTLQG
jgi:hypothetical protein